MCCSCVPYMTYYTGWLPVCQAFFLIFCKYFLFIFLEVFTWYRLSVPSIPNYPSTKSSKGNNQSNCKPDNPCRAGGGRSGVAHCNNGIGAGNVVQQGLGDVVSIHSINLRSMFCCISYLCIHDITWLPVCQQLFYLCMYVSMHKDTPLCLCTLYIMLSTCRAQISNNCPVRIMRRRGLWRSTILSLLVIACFSTLAH